MSVIYSSATILAASVENNAGGACARDLGIAGGIAGFAIIFMLMGGLGHRGGLIPTLGWFERFSEKVSGQPAWASLPCGLAIISLITALFGLYWDVSLHIDKGRDAGVFSNPSHMFILGGLYGIFAAGFFACCLGREERADRPGPTAIRVGKDWYAPLGGLMMMITGGFSLIAFPLDDFWHRLFGQDVTLWGPTHLMLIGGAVMTLLAIAIIQAEVVRAMKVAGVMHKEMAWVRHLRVVWLPGGLLVGMSTFQGEFDFGVPQFQMIFHPLLIMLAAGLTLDHDAHLARPRRAVRRDRLLHHLPRPARPHRHRRAGRVADELPAVHRRGALRRGRRAVRRHPPPAAFGLTAGALIGTVGLAAEWGWSHVWMPLPWSVEILPETIVLGLAMAISASILGAWIGARLSADDLPYAETSHIRPYAVVAAVGDLRDARVPAVHEVDDRRARRRRADERRQRRQAHGERDGHAHPARRRRARQLVHDDLLAGRRAPHHRPPGARRRGRLPHDAAGPRLRRVEDDAAPARGPLDPRPGRSTRRRTGRSRSPPSRRRRASPASSSPTRSCCSARPRRTRTWITYAAYGTVLAFALGLLGDARLGHPPRRHDGGRQARHADPRVGAAARAHDGGRSRARADRHRAGAA